MKRRASLLAAAGVSVLVVAVIFVGSLRKTWGVSSQGPAAAAPIPGVYSGEIRAFAGASCPAGWLLADGTEVMVAQHQNLNAAIGDLWGSTANDRFKLPDLRGTFLRGWNNSRASGGDPEATTRSIPAGAPVSAKGGDQVGTNQSDAFRSHNHKTPATARWGDKYADVIGFSADNGQYPGGANTNLPTDSNGGTETRPQNVYVLYCIKD